MIWNSFLISIRFGSGVEEGDYGIGKNAGLLNDPLLMGGAGMGMGTIPHHLGGAWLPPFGGGFSKLPPYGGGLFKPPFMTSMPSFGAYGQGTGMDMGMGMGMGAGGGGMHAGLGRSGLPIDPQTLGVNPLLNQYNSLSPDRPHPTMEQMKHLDELAAGFYGMNAGVGPTLAQVENFAQQMAECPAAVVQGHPTLGEMTEAYVGCGMNYGMGFSGADKAKLGSVAPPGYQVNAAHNLIDFTDKASPLTRYGFQAKEGPGTEGDDDDTYYSNTGKAEKKIKWLKRSLVGMVISILAVIFASLTILPKPQQDHSGHSPQSGDISVFPEELPLLDTVAAAGIVKKTLSHSAAPRHNPPNGCVTLHPRKPGTGFEHEDSTIENNGGLWNPPTSFASFVIPTDAHEIFTQVHGLDGVGEVSYSTYDPDSVDLDAVLRHSIVSETRHGGAPWQGGYVQIIVERIDDRTAEKQNKQSTSLNGHDDTVISRESLGDTEACLVQKLGFDGMIEGTGVEVFSPYPAGRDKQSASGSHSSHRLKIQVLFPLSKQRGHSLAHVPTTQEGWPSPSPDFVPSFEFRGSVFDVAFGNLSSANIGEIKVDLQGGDVEVEDLKVERAFFRSAGKHSGRIGDIKGKIEVADKLEVQDRE